MKRYIKSSDYTSARSYKDPKSKKMALKQYLSEVDAYLRNEFGKEVKASLELSGLAPYFYANYDSEYFLHVWMMTNSIEDKVGEDLGNPNVYYGRSTTTFPKEAKAKIRFYVEQAFSLLASKGFDIKTSPKNVGGQFYVVATTEELDNILQEYEQ